MNETTAPNAASAETEGLLDRLRTTYAQRATVLEELRRGVGHAERDAILLELCAFRGMLYTEAAELIGYTREGVARRIRPLVTELGLDDLTLIQRQAAKVTRPHRRTPIDQLKDRLRPSPEVQAAKQAEADRLEAEIIELMDQLHAAGMSWVELASRMEISVPTLQRLRGAM